MPPRKIARPSYPFNGVNRGVYIADNLDFLRSLNDECVDLVCIDPPFDKNETFTAETLKPPLTAAEEQNELRLLAQWGIETPEQAAAVELEWPADHKLKGGYKDIWRWDADIHEDWVKTLEIHYPAINSLIETTRLIHSDGRAAYLCFMAIRLVEIRRILKPTGSLYLHCDHAANGYLRQLLDAVFGNGDNGKPGFKNEIIWRRTHSKNAVTSRYGTNHDTIFFYGKTNQPNFFKDRAFRPFDTSETPGGYKLEKETGRLYALSPVHAPGPRTGNSGQPATFRGITYEPPVGRHWTIQGGKLPSETTTQAWDRLDQQGRMYLAPNGKLPTYIRYLDEMPGIALDDVWTDLTIPASNERTGYPTQKPVALAERIINASTNPGDVVVDCFAGCAYTAIAAERMGRRWLACDMNIRAWTVFKRQFNKPHLVTLTCNDETVGQQVMCSEYAQVFGLNDLPQRESPPPPITLAPLPIAERKYRQPRQKPVMTEDEMLRELLEFSGYTAWCCGFANRKPNGEVIRQTWNFHLDHIDPVSAGGINEIFNRAPMCPYHNIRKSNQLVALRQYRNQIAAAGELQVDNILQLVDLGEAQRYANRIYAQYERERRPQQTMGV